MSFCDCSRSNNHVEEGSRINDYYIVKRATFPNFTHDDNEELDYWEGDEDDTVLDIDIDDFYPIEPDEVSSKEDEENKMIEAAVFLDPVGYQRLAQVG